jgi:uncharacterized OB-fold protein
LQLVEVKERGNVYSFTVNYQPILPDVPVPYALVVVQFPSYPGFRIFGKLRGCPPEDVHVGLEVEIGFEPGPGGVHVPSFLAVASTADVRTTQ